MKKILLFCLLVSTLSLEAKVTNSKTTPLITVYVTCPNQEVADTIANHLIDKHLIACANIFPIASVYRWEGKIERGQEFVLLGKTTAAKYEAICDAVVKIHPYEVPCIEKFAVEANKPFAAWVATEVK